MKAFLDFSILLGIVVILVKSSIASPQARILDGTPVDTLKRFPYYVTITREGKYCGGSIISNQWILTALHCVPGGEFTVHFLMMSLKSSGPSFSITLGDSAVVPYPTDYDNIALIKLPVVLQFSELLTSVAYTQGTGENFGNGFVVMAGFSPNQTDILTYGMFKLIPANECKIRYGNSFDEYLQICTSGWNNNQMPCEGNEGGGLIVGWPQKPRLIGIFSSPLKCVPGEPAVYVKLAQYEWWIRDTIGDQFQITENPYPRTT